MTDSALLERKPDIETKSDFFDRIEPIITKQAHRQLKGSEILEVQDIEQEIRLELLAKYEHVKGLDDNQLSYLAYQAAATYCAKERTDYAYFTGNFIYSGEMVENLLKDHVFVDLDGDVDVEGRVDVLTALKQLSTRRQAAVIKRYCLGEPLDKNEDKLRAKGLRQMTDYLNRGTGKGRVDIDAASEER
ncbi:hypothetical protein [Glutamicibacter arilaitensis]|uniref:hypothetical protein n=1 Tax=Glutamicibacter arilaitensis TaxID=256701 RepID=UPI003F927C7C